MENKTLEKISSLAKHFKLSTYTEKLSQKLKFATGSQINFILIAYSIPLACNIINKYKLYDIQFVFSLFFLLLLYGHLQVLYLLFFVSINMAAVVFWSNKRKKSVFSESFCFLFAMTTLFASHFYFKILNIPEDTDICSSLMTINILVFWLAKEYENKKINPKSALEMLNYLLNTPAVFFGPAVPLSNMKISKTEKESEKPFLNEGVRKILMSLVYLVTHVVLREVFKFKTGKSFLWNYLNILLSGLAIRCKFYFVWTLSCSYFYYYGINNIVNIKPLSLEMAASVKDLTDNWNIYTNLWLKHAVFLVFKSKSKFLAAVLTFFASSFYHGPNLSYLLMFITIAFISKPLHIFLMRFDRIFTNRIINRLLKWFIMFSLLGYLCVPFVVLNFKNTFNIWKGAYFYGHIFLAAMAASNLVLNMI